MNLKEYKEISELLGMLFKLGFTICICIGGFLYLGITIEKKFNCNGILIVLSIFAGIAFAVFNAYTNIKKYIQDDEKRKQLSKRN